MSWTIDLFLSLHEAESRLLPLAAKVLGQSPEDLGGVVILRRFVDARRRGSVRLGYRVEVMGAGEALPEPWRRDPLGPEVEERAPGVVILGAGPAGLFAALRLLDRGIRPMLVERGQPLLERRRSVAAFLRRGELDPESNICFGEGGAGTFSDGKLTARGRGSDVEQVMAWLFRLGVSRHRLSWSRPHLGTDGLHGVLRELQRSILRRGGLFLFGAKAVGLVQSAGGVRGVRLADGREVVGQALILAPGGSARDLFGAFLKEGVAMEAKGLAVGVRVEHPQALVDEIQHRDLAGHPRLGPAEYRMTAKASQGRGVYTFCMCPGGVIVPVATEPGRLATNGMSGSLRNGPLANSAVVVTVGERDFSEGPLGGVEFQRRIEEAAFGAGGGGYRAPAQRMIDFLEGRAGASLPRSSYRPGLTPHDLGSIFPLEIAQALREGMRAMGNQMRGFVTEEALLVGAETRTSCPVRLLRGGDLASLSHRGLYPAGEGAGYAGGIVSSAADGLRVAEAVAGSLGGAL